MHTNRRYFEVWIVVIAATLTLLNSATSRAQTTTAMLKGTVLDASNAIVPNASVSLKNEASGDVRRTASNGDGYFAFAAVPPGSYTLTVEKEGFSTWAAKSVVLNSGDERNVLGISLKPGTTKEVVTVEATGSSITPEDSGEKSALITEKIIQNVAIQGQNAAEFVKIMPGMAYTGGALNQASYVGEDQRTGAGPVGNFSANGQRTAALDITSDGAHILDPGCNCGQAMNTNAEMTSEMKVMTSNFGADESKGPIVINTIGKSGGQQFHGEAYLYSRYYTFNANDWLNNHAGLNNQGQLVAPRPETKYFYPGFQIGGPVIFPHSDFNRNRDKMFFFFATQAYRQDVDYGIYHAVVPTQAMRNGDFSQTLGGQPYVSSLNGYAVSGVPNGNGWTNGVFTGTPDPTGTGPALLKTYPLDNVDPRYNQGFNYIKAAVRKSNMMQFRGKVDYNFSDSTKLYVSYNHQHDDALNSLDVLWAGSAQSWAAPTTPYPTPIAATSTSDVITANLTKVFSPTLTNEVVFSYTYLNLPNHFSDPSKVERQSLGINYNLLFSHPDPQKLIFPQMTGWGDGISNMLNTGFELNGTVYAKKTLPSVADNVVKVWKTHTSKFGFYWERTWNQQPGNGSVNGSAIFSNWGSNGSGNAYADMLMGQTTQYSELNFDVVPAFRYISAEFYGQDSWKVSRRVTLEYGLRVSHLGPWSDTTGYGFAAWYPNLYASGTGGSVNGATFPGIEWHSVNSSTPLSGSASRLFYYNPRAGFAWDIFGNGRTVLRGGYGMYHFHDEQNVQNGAYSIVRGSFNSPTLWSPKFADLGPNLATLATPSGVVALDPRDNQEPRTQSYSLTVAERLPWKSQLEVAYVGNKSDYLSNWNNNFDQINDLGVNSLFTAYGWLPDCYPKGMPNDGGACSQTGADTGYSTSAVTNARPLSYGTLKIIDHKMYSNYNSMQVSWNKQSGRFSFMTNYTYSKALGIRGEGGSATGDPTNLGNNYGTLPNNRTHIFNVAYVYEFPTLHSGNRFVRGAANGWQVSGITQYQSGSDLQAAITSNFNYSGFIPAGTTFMGETITEPIQASASNVLGTPDITLMPKVICNPRSGLKPHQYVNGNCFSPFATPGQQGSYIFPTLTGPGFFNSDLSVFKNFTWGSSESKKLQFRFSGYNFLNHPITTFIQSDPALNLTFDKTGVLQAPGPGVTFGTAGYKTGHRIMQGVVKFTW
jgi:hypothetical protein